jgi:hypothetical protein
VEKGGSIHCSLQSDPSSVTDTCQVLLLAVIHCDPGINRAHFRCAVLFTKASSLTSNDCALRTPNRERSGVVQNCHTDVVVAGTLNSVRVP